MSIALNIFDSLQTEVDIDQLLNQRSTESLHLEFKTKRVSNSPDLTCGLDVNLSEKSASRPHMDFIMFELSKSTLRLLASGIDYTCSRQAS